MNTKNKFQFLHFAFRPQMYIKPVDLNNILSYMTGYQIGSSTNFSFYDIVSNTLSIDYKIKASNTGLLGRISELAVKLRTTEVEAFKKVALESLIGNGDNDKLIKEIRKLFIITIDRMKDVDNDKFNTEWLYKDWCFFIKINPKKQKLIFSMEELKLITIIEKKSTTISYGVTLQKLLNSMN